MKPRKHTIWDEINRMQDELDSLFGNFGSMTPWMRFTDHPLLTAPGSAESSDQTPIKFRNALCDVCETDTDFLVNVEIPGVNKEDIRINVEDGSIEIKAERKQELKKEDKKTGSYSAATSAIGFYRHLGLPENVEVKKIAAKYKDGILELKLPKAASAQKKGFEVKVD
jgi:HSP20 family protein